MQRGISYTLQSSAHFLILAWLGTWAALLIALLAAEIVVTLADFTVEERVRSRLGGLYAGERVTHAVMGIIYGAMLAYLVPVLIGWWKLPSGFAPRPAGVPGILRWGLVGMGGGVFLSGLRDLGASLRLPYARWPWRVPE